MKTIRVRDKHVYLDDRDISEFVVDVVVQSGELVLVTLIGNVVDERAPQPVKEKVKDGDRKNYTKAY